MKKSDRADAVDAAWDALESAAVAKAREAVLSARRKCEEGGAGPRPMPTRSRVDVHVDVHADPW